MEYYSLDKRVAFKVFRAEWDSMAFQENSSLKKKVESEFIEEGANLTKLVKTLIRSFLRADSDYGAIADIKTDVNYIYKLVKNYIAKEGLDIYALKLGNRILMSKTNLGFDKLYEVIRGRSRLEAKKDNVEIWDDSENRILHFIIIPLRKHLPIEYKADEREKIIGILLKKYGNI